MSGIIKVFRGLVLNPVLVSVARGAAEGALFLAVYSFIDAINSGQLNDTFGQFGPLVVMGLRMAEGVIDKVDPEKQRRRDVLRSSPITDGDGNVLPDAEIAADYGEHV